MTTISLEGAICEACRQEAAVEAVQDDNPHEPYILCRGCAVRLRLVALNPLEWFNLAAKHSVSEHYLHDDFYDDDGVACQPKVEDWTPTGPPAPRLEEVAGSLQRLMDYCLTRWSTGPAEYEALKRFDDQQILEQLIGRNRNGNPGLLASSLYLCANTIGPVGAAWVETQFEPARRGDILHHWAEAAAECLPRELGLSMTMRAVEAYETPELHHKIWALATFRSSQVLDWIEQHAPPVSITFGWGSVAACSEINWDRVYDWLRRGRPLSLIALDALVSLPHRPVGIEEYEMPKLRGRPDRSFVVSVLRDYAAKDDVPRVEGAVRYVLEHLDEILED